MIRVIKLCLLPSALLFTACAESEQETNPLAVDDDGDGYSEFDGDCNDNDPNSTTLEDDADCDGLRSEEDCDDNDPASTAITEDADCDGVLKGDDCDDNDKELGSKTLNPNCDTE